MNNISWASGDSYERFIGRWSRVVAREFISRLGAPQRMRWLDIGCGTGALSQAIGDLASPVAVEACDPSESHIAFAGNAFPPGFSRASILARS